MKFLYQYKTRENERRDGVIFAPNRDAVYAQLKKQGIRPFCVELAPGLLNTLQRPGKRGYAIIFLAFALIATLVLSLRRGGDNDSSFEGSEAFERMSRRVSEIVVNATNDLTKARADMRELFSKEFDSLADDRREREAAMMLYGEASLEIDRLADEMRRLKATESNE